MPQCFRSLDPGSLDHGKRLDIHRSGNTTVFSLTKRLSIVLEIVSNCKVTRTKTKNPYVRNRKVGNIFNGRIDIFRAWEGEFFIDRNTDESRVVNRGTIST